MQLLTSGCRNAAYKKRTQAAYLELVLDKGWDLERHTQQATCAFMAQEPIEELSFFLKIPSFVLELTSTVFHEGIYVFLFCFRKYTKK